MRQTATRYVLLALLLLIVAASPTEAANGDLIGCWTSGALEVCTYSMLDAQEATDAGTAVYVGPWERMTFWPISGVDGSNTWSVDCAANGNRELTPTVWITVQAATSSTDAKRMQDGDTCEWVRVPKDTDDGTATTVRMQVARSRR